jgi:Spy/CpxP family protein refolding chaperone
MRARIPHVAIAGLLAATVAAAPAASLPGRRGHAGHPPRLAAMVDYLDLDAAQETAWKELWRGLAATTRPLRDERRALRERLADTLSASDPDAAEVGALVVALHENREAMRGARDTQLEGFAALLTPEQAKKLEDLRQWMEARRARGRHS